MRKGEGLPLRPGKKQAQEHAVTEQPEYIDGPADIDTQGRKVDKPRPRPRGMP